VSERISIPGRFNGPPASANGGYTCGLVAGTLGAGAAEVNLHAPPPLERPLQVEREEEEVLVRDGDTVVARGRPTQVEVELATSVSPDAAAGAAHEGLHRWKAGHPFPTCFVCGPDRGEGDGMRIFPGPLGDGTFAAGWTPEPSLADDEGAVRTECVWAALDCPTSAPVANWGEGPPIVLARLAAATEAPVRVGEPHALLSWELGRDGRKREAACVLLDSAGKVLARSRALWIELREA
jgi:hypothetical protein